MHIFYEALIVGVISAIIGFFVILSISIYKNENVSFDKDWSTILFPFFVTGFMFHLLFEWTNVNKLYCDYKKNEKLIEKPIH